MSDVSHGPGWWQASDGKWYSPEQRPAFQPPAFQPPAFQPPASQAPAAAYPSGTYAIGSTIGPLASWGIRVVAALIDSAAVVVVVIVGSVMVLIASAVASSLRPVIGGLVYLVYLAVTFYFTYMTGVSGQSPGKKVMGIKVVSERTGQVIGGGLGIVRGLLHLVDYFLFCVGFLYPLWDWKRQTIADKMVNTVVLSDLPKRSLSVDLLKVR